MVLVAENGRAQWSSNPTYIRILYSITKVYMEEKDLRNIPVGSDRHCKEIADRFSLAIGEDIRGSQVSGVLYLQFDSTYFPNNVSESHLLKLQIGLEVGLINSNVFITLF